MATTQAKVTVKVDTSALAAALRAIAWGFTRHQWIRYAHGGWRSPPLELTTGAERPPDICKCRITLADTGTGFYPQIYSNPACTADVCHTRLRRLRLRPVERYGKAPACMCLYGVRRVEGAPGPYAPIDPYGRYPGRRWGTWAFKIHPRCPHHGEARTAYLEVSRETLAEIVLDEDERNNR